MVLFFKKGLLASLFAAATLPGARAEAPAVYRFPSPPAGFSPLTASNEALAAYGLPPRPAANAHAALSLATWTQAMSHARAAVVPRVVRTGRRHMRALVVKATRTLQAGSMVSTNWAGQALLNPAGSSFGASSYAEVVGQWQISAVQQAIGTCSGTDVSAIWIGIDGADGSGSSDVMQAGTEADASCGNGVTRPSYYAWFEWYPGDEYAIDNFPVAPGGSMLVVVQATSATTANATFVNVQSNQYTVVGFSAPAGTTLKGDSAEWIVERPTVNNVLGSLADYGLVWMSSEVAYLDSELNTGSYDVAGSGGPGRIPYTMNMVTAGGAPLTYAYPQGTTAQYLNVAGTAYRN